MRFLSSSFPPLDSSRAHKGVLERHNLRYRGCMTIRRRVQRWAAVKGISIDGDLRTSKYYPPAESRSGRPAWWVEVPLDKLPSVLKFDVFCEKGIEIEDFHHLAVPSAYLDQNQRNVYITNGEISLWLSAEEPNLFIDVHAEGHHVDFRRFLVA